MAPATPSPKPFLGIRFTCCNAYARIYLTHDGKAFAGHCPKCLRHIRIAVGKEGSKSRFWVVE
jgi:hypothetical protein